jgi:hypothetical protein
MTLLFPKKITTIDVIRFYCLIKGKKDGEINIVSISTISIGFLQ